MPSREFSMTSPLWGRCRIIPRDAEPTDSIAMGYVALEGEPELLTVAIWKEGGWLKPNLKPFPKPVAQSYRVEKADGSPLF